MNKIQKTVWHAALAWVVLGPWLAASQHQPDAPGSKVETLPLQSKVIYGEDDRIDLYEEDDLRHRAWAASVCALVHTDQVTPGEASDYTLRTVPLLLDRTYTLGDWFSATTLLSLCKAARFASQPAAPFCTGFLVAPDLIATAGHCTIEFDDPTGITAVFGFTMRDENSAVTEFASDQVYIIVEKVAEIFRNNVDYAILRTDRPVTAPGALPLPVRRSGLLPRGTPLGTIGHPLGLPLKLAFGRDATVWDNSPARYFTANIDTFHGNSGSPVFNATSGVVEGILVAVSYDDFRKFPFWCLSPFVVRDDKYGVRVTRSNQFSEALYDPRGQVTTDRLAYRCDDTIQVLVTDADLEEAPTANAVLLSSGGDQETLTLTPSGRAFQFEGTVSIAETAIQPEDGLLQVFEGDLITAAYVDEDNGSGERALVEAGAFIDCTPPVVEQLALEPWAKSVRVTFTTNEAVLPSVGTADVCGNSTEFRDGPLGLEHDLVLSGLSPDSNYVVTVNGTDQAGNEVSGAADQLCAPFITTPFMDHFTEGLFDKTSDLIGKSVLFTPQGAGYDACIMDSTEFPASPCGWPLFLARPEALPDRLIPETREHRFTRGREFPFFGVLYDRMYISRNGCITFGEADGNLDVTFANHFQLPRIAMYYTPLYPDEESRVLLGQSAEGVVLTFEDVPDGSGDRHSFQAELFLDGRIRLSWMKLTRPIGIVGLSRGGGAPGQFEMTDFSAYPACTNPPAGMDATPFCVKGFLACGTASHGHRNTRLGDAMVMAAAILLLGLPVRATARMRGRE